MNLDLDRLEALANAVGGDQWTPTYATRTDLAAVWLPDGDLVCRCHGNIGHWPDPINADDVAEFIAAAKATMLALIAEVRALREDVQAAKLLAHANGEMFKAEKAENEALRRQSLELLGVVIDVEQGGGFDDACLATIKRVMNVLAGKEKA